MACAQLLWGLRRCLLATSTCSLGRNAYSIPCSNPRCNLQHAAGSRSAQPYKVLMTTVPYRRWSRCGLVTPVSLAQGFIWALPYQRREARISRPSFPPPSTFVVGISLFLETAALGCRGKILKQALPSQKSLPCSGEGTAQCTWSDHSRGHSWPDQALSEGALACGPLESLLSA